VALLELKSDLTQGTSNAVSDITFTASSGINTTINGAATLPTLADDEFFEIRGHRLASNNGLYRVNDASITTSEITVEKVSGANPQNDAVADAVTLLGDSTTPKNIFYDTLANHYYLIKQNGLTDDGVLVAAVYGASMRDFKDDAFLVANAPMMMIAIDNDAGKYIFGQDASGNFNGFRPEDNSTFGINTRKLMRSGGWEERDNLGNLLAVESNISTLGAFDAPGTDTAYYIFGDPRDTTVDNSTNFDFAGPVNEAVRSYERLADGTVNGGTGIAISTDGRTLTRSDGGNWSTEGVNASFIVGGRIGIRDAENATSDTGETNGFLLSAVGTGVDGAVTVGTAAEATATLAPNFVDGGGGNDQIVRDDGKSWIDEGYFVGGVVVVANATTVANDGTYTILALTASTIDVATASFTADTEDTAATFGPIDPTGTPDTTMNVSIDNRNQITLFLRERGGGANGKTFSQANLASAGETVLGNRKFTFGLANAVDLDISETDANIDANTPYTGMTITFYSTAQSLGGPGADELVGGPYNFGIVVVCNNGTSNEVYEWLQRQLRKTTDIDNDADTAIGRAIDGLCRFLGPQFQAGSTDGGLSFPVNPDGGGSGVMLTGLNANSRNDTIVFDNTGAQRGYPIGTPVTLDFNAQLEGDVASEYTLFFDYTIRTTVSDLIVTAVSGATCTFDSAGAGLPAAMDIDPNGYARLTGYSGADAAMNGIYQVTATTSTSQWSAVRVDNATVVTTASASIFVDEHPIDSPDAIIVQDNAPADVSGVATSDVNFTFDYSNNNQGGRTTATDAFVVCRAIGESGAQFTQTTVQTIPSATPTTIVVSAVEERNN
jgi:hypothetical protein